MGINNHKNKFAMKEIFSKENLPYWIMAVIVLGLMSFALFYFSEATPVKSGIVAFFSAIIGVVLTAIAISIQLKHQSDQLKQQSDTEAQKERNQKIFEQKINVYSEFTEKMWEIVAKNQNTTNLLEDLRKICFKEFIFFLDDNQIKKISEQIADIKEDKAPPKAASEITKILQDNLQQEIFVKNENKNAHNPLVELYASFNEESSEDNTAYKKNIQTSASEENIQVSASEKNIQVSTSEENIQTSRSEENIHTSASEENIQASTSSDGGLERITYWHFNMWDKEQIEAFKHDNWVLALTEYGENWRTNLVKQVRHNDVIFLFKRGGTGYIGAFRAKESPYKILIAKEFINEKEELIDEEYEKNKEFDIYHGIWDGATLASNLLVEPIAYNFKGVGYYSVRRSTIQRMNDMEAVKFLLNRFNEKELSNDQEIGIGKLDENKRVEISDKNKEYFSELIKKHNL
jgi:hypothetical protein